MSNNLAKLFYKVFKAYNVSITKHTIEKTIGTHPEYPTMQSISDALDSWKIKHVVLKLSLEKLRTLDVPVIAHLKRNNYIWITQITDSKVRFCSASGKEKTDSCDNFEKEWLGVVLAIEDVAKAGEPNYKEERRKEIKENIFRYIFAGGFISLLILLTCFSWLNDSSLYIIPKLLLLLVNAAGCFISYLLILQEKRQDNYLVQKFCKAGAHIDCNRVTMSRYSKLFGVFSWAEMGMAYFTTVILWLAIAPISASWLSPLWWFLIAPLPFTVWSLLTQAFFIRKWCLFCCTIVLLLWINAAILCFFVSFGCVVPIVESSLLALLFLVCATLVLYVCKTGIFGDSYSEKRETARIKYDFKTMQSQLSEFQFKTVNAGFVWGNIQATQEIALYVSITCSSCGSAVKEFRRLTEIYPDICFRLIFLVKTDDFEHVSNIIIRHFISIYRAMNKNDFFDMLDVWYTAMNKNLEALQKKYPVLTIQNDDAEIEALYQFDQQAKIKYTPAIMLNGRLLSQLYSYQDLYGIARTLNAEIS